MSANRLPRLKADDECVAFMRALSRGDERTIRVILEDRMIQAGACRKRSLQDFAWEVEWDRVVVARVLRDLAAEIGGSDAR